MENTNEVFIQDKLTGEFYCVSMTEKDASGNLTVGDNDFPFWSANKNKACNFGNVMLAEHEMNCNDLTNDGIRNPQIIDMLNDLKG